MKNRMPTIIAVGLVCCMATSVVFAQTKKKSSKVVPKKPTTAAAAPQVTPTKEVLSLDSAPAPLPTKNFEFPEFEEFELTNGLHVYVVPNNEVPTVTISMVVRAGDAYDPKGKEGVAVLMADMLNKGTKSRTAQQLAEALDGVGASLSASVVGESISITANALKKHAPLVFDILGEQLTKPAFDEAELSKLKQQAIASIAYDRSRPSEVAQALSRKVIYGMDNPLARKRSELSVQAISVQDIEAYFSTWIRPNNASIAIIGDVTTKEAKEYINKYLQAWEKKATPDVAIPELRSEPAGVYFVARKGAVQSMVIACAAAPAVKAPDFYATSVMSSFIGSGFGSLLNATLRETYSYTYSPFGFCTRGKRYNRIAVGAEVRTSVTDSAINVILREIKKLASEGPQEDQFARRIALEAGQFRMSLERPSNVANVLQNSWLNDQPVSVATSYATEVENLASVDIQDAASRYLDMFKLRLVVVGSPEVKERLQQFGKVYEFNASLVPVAADQLEVVSFSVSEVLAKYESALGGKQAISALKTMISKGSVELSMQGQVYKGTITRSTMAPQSEKMELVFPQFSQAQWIHNGKVMQSFNNSPAMPASPEETPKLLADAMVFPALGITSSGYTTKVVGKQTGHIIVEATTPWMSTDRYYFHADNGLLHYTEKEQPGPSGPITVVEKFEQYSQVAGVQMPTVIKQQSSVMQATFTLTHNANATLTDADFVPKH
jgi:zinc protease